MLRLELNIRPYSWHLKEGWNGEDQRAAAAQRASGLRRGSSRQRGRAGGQGTQPPPIWSSRREKRAEESAAKASCAAKRARERGRVGLGNVRGRLGGLAWARGSLTPAQAPTERLWWCGFSCETAVRPVRLARSFAITCNSAEQGSNRPRTAVKREEFWVKLPPFGSSRWFGSARQTVEKRAGGPQGFG